jgi:glycosyltransferase involved in cell wall biosynthesis
MEKASSRMDSPIFSIIIPARNEARDIAETLEAVLAMRYEPKEIIVVDDSSDETPRIVSRYADQGVRLIQREHNRNGCCGARNLGMKMARGEIVVLLNADDRPQRDFLQRILHHYRAGADYVIVRSAVKNRDNIWGQYVFASGQVHRTDHPDHTWSEGFSCRRAAAEAIGFIPGDFRIPFCRDNMLGARLEEAGYQKVFDLSIPMEHIAPGNLREYWRNQVWRASFSSPYALYFRRLSMPWIALREVMKAARTVLRIVLVLPILKRALRCSRFTPHGWHSLPGLLYVSLVQDLAHLVGNFRGLIQVVRVEGRWRIKGCPT